jgi:uncharacterized protein YuzE
LRSLIDKSGTVVARVDLGKVRPGPLEEDVRRDVQAMLETGDVVEVDCDRDRQVCGVRIRGDDGERFMTVLLGLDDSDDYSITSTVEE